jgi:hypothetical protein
MHFKNTFACAISAETGLLAWLRLSLRLLP